ncbi:transcription factor HES-5-like [Rhinophrynus dorsalis]
MAPNEILDHPKITPKVKNKRRKPAVEKMRRDRINGSIEQLKVLLEKVVHKQQPNVKLEKADILEMTVTYLRQQRPLPTKNEAHLGNDVQVGFKDGYTKCFEEVLDFLSLQKRHQETESKVLHHFHSKATPTCRLPLSPLSYCPSKQADAITSSALWRPW